MLTFLTNSIVNFGIIILLLIIKQASFIQVKVYGTTSCSSVILVPEPRG